MIPLAFKLPTPYIIITMAGSDKICQNNTEMEKCIELWIWRVSSGLWQITIIITKMRIKYCSICKAAPLFQYTVSKMFRDRASRNCLWSCSFRHKHLQGSRQTFSSLTTARQSRGPSPSYPAAIHWPPKHTVWFLYSAVSLRLSSYSLGLVWNSPPLKIPRWNSISSSRSRINISLDVKFPLNPWFIWIYRPPGLPSYKEHLVTFPSHPHP